MVFVKIKKDNFTNETLRRLQLTQLEMLKEIVRICDKHNLQYYLIGGTLLGAVRHKGFIPWDDDLDIAMPRKDYEKLIVLYSNEFPNEYFIDSFETNPDYYLPFCKVRKKNTILCEALYKNAKNKKEIFVDIFPLDLTDNLSAGNSILTKIIKNLTTQMQKKANVELNMSLPSKIVSFMLFSVSAKKLGNWQKKLMMRANKKSSMYYINYGSNYNTVKQTIPVEKYDDAVYIEFEGDFYKAPADYDYILKRIYGDYNKLPPEEKRVLRHRPEYIDFGD